MAHWATLTLSQMLWGHSNMTECVRKKIAGWKVFSPQHLKGALPLRPDNQKNFSACEKSFSHISSATAFGWGLGSIALAACHGFASAGAVTLDTCYPLWGCSLWTLPWPSHGHPKCNCTITRKAMAHWATLTLSQMLWGHSNMTECVRKKNRRLKSFFSTRLKRSIATATRQPEKKISLWKVFFRIFLRPLRLAEG